MHMAQIDPMLLISRQVGKLMILSQQQQLNTFLLNTLNMQRQTPTQVSIIFEVDTPEQLCLGKL